MFFNNPWGYHIANGTMPSLDFDSIDDKDYLKKQIIALSFMTFGDVLIIVLSIIANIIWGTLFSIIVLTIICIKGWIDIIKFYKQYKKEKNESKSKTNWRSN